MIAADPRQASETRLWPLTIRITNHERRLLRLASRQLRTTQTELVRNGLNPVLQQLAERFDSDGG